MMAVEGRSGTTRQTGHGGRIAVRSERDDDEKMWGRGGLLRENHSCWENLHASTHTAWNPSKLLLGKPTGKRKTARPFPVVRLPTGPSGKNYDAHDEPDDGASGFSAERREYASRCGPELDSPSKARYAMTSTTGLGTTGISLDLTPGRITRF